MHGPEAKKLNEASNTHCVQSPSKIQSYMSALRDVEQLALKT